MELTDRGVVVTGAGGGIGRSLAHALTRAGARVLLTDVNADSVAQTAAQTGAIAFPGDLTDPDFPAQLVDHANQQLGFVDVFFSNAGVESGFAPDADDRAWQLAYEVNVLAHVRAARALVPAWTAAGRGHLVITASAAGLLTMLGDGPYSVTKHAAVAYGEWLAIEHAQDGITVQALCPQGVNTRMLQDAGPLKDLLSADGALEPDDVAAATLEALGNGRYLILPHPEVARYYAHRASDTDRWLGTMTRLRSRL
jgi:NAD(P)-dependent dehydrogenase (short-subunit alcohol dehydrogenase family)